jgi:hypothetical protein
MPWPVLELRALQHIGREYGEPQEVGKEGSQKLFKVLATCLLAIYD